MARTPRGPADRHKTLMMKRLLLVLAIPLLLAIAFGCQDVDYRGRLVRAEKLADDGRYEDALRALRTLASESKDTTVARKARFQSAMILWQHTQQLEQARDELLQVLAQATTTTEVLEIRLALAELLFSRLEDYRSAIVELKILSQETGPYRDIHQFRLGKSHFYLGEFQLAVEAFQNLYQETKSENLKAVAIFEIATSLSAMGRFNEAISHYQQIEEKYPGTPMAEQSTIGVASSLESSQDLRGAMAIYQTLRPSPLITARMESLSERMKSAPPPSRPERTRPRGARDTRDKRP